MKLVPCSVQLQGCKVLVLPMALLFFWCSVKDATLGELRHKVVNWNFLGL